jgi:hypothetical protein
VLSPATGVPASRGQDRVGTPDPGARVTGPATVGDMTTTSAAAAPTSPRPSVPRPSLPRRLALAVTGVPALALPLVWGLGSLVELLTGHEADHRFHQVTGQGVLLGVLWALGPVALLLAGWRGRQPAAWAGPAHLAFVIATAVAAAFVPGDGVVPLAGVVVVTGALLWWALPVRPPVRGTVTGLDPVLTPVALVATALFAPYVLAQRTLQADRHDEHAAMTHYFDMAWVSLAVVALLLIAASCRGARPLTVPAGAGCLVIGSAGLLLLDHGTTWSAGVVALGVAVLAAGRLQRAEPTADDRAAV